ncbi:pseudouridine-5'-phosphatase-like isoform X1 [Onthophagus taurus]|uniref:pseudouridine-5'-phosphatase-like isoform X1 n=2 Tax=Onthophagus taurus TaxID=166361 RepID=UPI0039BE1EF9
MSIINHHRWVKIVCGSHFLVFRFQKCLYGYTTSPSKNDKKFITSPSFNVKVTHCIFDMDGLMFDTETIYEQVYKKIANQYGKQFTEELKVKIMGRPELDGANVYVKELGIPLSGEQFLKVFKPMARSHFQNPRIMPGVEKLVRHLAKHSIPLGVATSSHKDDEAIKTQNHRDFYRLFHHTVCGSSDHEVKHGKPAPDIYLICAARFPDKPKPENVLVFEDAPNGVAGAIAAGMSCVMVPDPTIFKHLPKLLTAQPTLILSSMTKFKPELFNLPKFD